MEAEERRARGAATGEAREEVYAGRRARENMVARESQGVENQTKDLSLLSQFVPNNFKFREGNSPPPPTDSQTR